MYLAHMLAHTYPEKDDETLLSEIEGMDKERRLRGRLTAEQVREVALKNFAGGRASGLKKKATEGKSAKKAGRAGKT